MSGRRIAILGATSHIAKNLIGRMASENELSLFARSTEKVVAFLESEGINTGAVKVRLIDSFGIMNDHYDAIINCVGIGTPEKLKSQGAEVFFVAERYDNMVLDYLAINASTTYVNFSSGAVYGTDTYGAVNENCEFRIGLGAISIADAYRVSKLNSEAKHRSLADYSIVDLRLFSFFSRYIDLGSSYLIAEIVNSIHNGTEFVTSSTDIIRDYVHPQDLCNLACLCIKAKGINRPIDVYSSHYTKKSEIIEAFKLRFGLRVRIMDEPMKISPTGVKSCYASNSRDAEKILNYRPQYTSINALLDEAQALLGKHG